LNNDWKAGKYEQVGFNAATYGHSILGVTKSPLTLTDKQILQALLDGVFTENTLPNTTTVIPCFDDATAHKVVLFVG
jgi:hypothetical protein